jgi:glycosyltransferase involved in cell wall biosynthesis
VKQVPKISVIVPSYNHARYVAEAVKSVLDQSEGDLELFVVDDGSTDESREILHAFHDERMHVIEQQNQGAHSALNKGLERSGGRFLAILNSDDVYHRKRLERMVGLLENDPSISLAGSHIEVVDAEGRFLGLKRGYHTLEPWLLEDPGRSFRAGNDLRGALLAENFWATTSNFVFTREWYKRVGGFRPLRFAHDWDFALRMAEEGQLLLEPEALLQYRVHQKNTIREDEAAMIFEICWCLAVNIPSHLRGTWYGEEPPEKRVEQLIHSIHTFAFDRVLSVMLLHGLSEDRQLAESLLNPDDPRRRVYIEFIRSHLTSGDGKGDAPGRADAVRPKGEDSAPASRLARALRGLKLGLSMTDRESGDRGDSR